MVDARLPDGSRVNAVLPPVALDGPLLTIRRFAAEGLSIDDMVARGSLTPPRPSCWARCVRGRLNVVVSGGTGTGKTTLLNAMAAYIGRDERIVTVEDAAELRLPQPHVARLETQAGERRGQGAIELRALVRNALRMRPDRIVVGEVRGPEALDMLQAMNTGHDGSLTTVHACVAGRCAAADRDDGADGRAGASARRGTRAGVRRRRRGRARVSCRRRRGGSCGRWTGTIGSEGELRRLDVELVAHLRESRCGC